MSSEEVARGKPAPDVYLEACRRLGVEPARAAAVEDSHAGIRSAKAAGMRVLAIPNPTYPPDDEALAERRRRAEFALRPHAGGCGDSVARPKRTQPLWPPRPIAFESATSTWTWRASFGT